MGNVCSNCSKQSDNELSPLCIRTGGKLKKTGLLEMLEAWKGKELVDLESKTYTPQYICNRCVFEACQAFFKDQGAEKNPAPSQVATKMADGRKAGAGEKVIEGDFTRMLDYDCLSMIFSYLPVSQVRQLEEVCTRWSEATELYWQGVKKLRVSYCEEYIESQLDVEKILGCCGRFLTHLDICRHCDSSIMIIIKDNCPNLINLKLEFEVKQESHFLDAFSNMEHLKELEITVEEFSAESADKVEFNFLHSLPSGLKKLFLSLPYLHGYSAGLRTSTDPELGARSQHALLMNFATVLEKLENIRRLKLRNCELDNVILSAISEKKNITFLKMANCKFTQDRLPLSNLSLLETLNFLRVSNKNGHLVSLGEDYENLTHFSLAECNDGGPVDLWKLSNAKKLTYLDLSYSPSLNNEAMIQISEACSEIKHLNLKMCEGLTALGFSKLGQLKQLESVNLERCRQIDVGIISMAQNCRNITELNLSKTWIIHSDIFKTIILFDKLVSLNLEATSIDDISVKMIVSNCNKLEYLYLYDCSDVSDKSMKIIYDSCPNLETLNLYGTGITLETLILALKKTKRRINGVVLTITVDEHLLRFFNKLKDNKSPYLKVDSICPELADSDSDSDDSDSDDEDDDDDDEDPDDEDEDDDNEDSDESDTDSDDGSGPFFVNIGKYKAMGVKVIDVSEFLAQEHENH